MLFRSALYPEVDPRVLKEYHTPCHYDDWLGDEPYAIGYVYFDIDGNGTEELILMVLCHEAMPFAVYAFDGENAVELGLVRGDRYGGYSIYANGMIAAYTGGSSTVYCRFNSDGYTVKRVSLSMDEIRGLDHYPAHEIWTGWEILADDISCHNICGHENRGMPEEEEKSSREFSAAITNTYPVFPYTSQLTVTLSDNTVAGTVFYDDGVYGEIELGDLTGDGQDEILVKVTDVGSNYGAVDIYVYTVKKSELIEILSLKSGNVGRVCPDLRYGIGASIENGCLRVEGAADYGDKWEEIYISVLLKYENGTWIQRGLIGTSEYIFPESNSRYLTKSDLAGFTPGLCRLARNEIYARHGRRFQDKELQRYFEWHTWYVPSVEAGDFNESCLNSYEIANRDLIAEFEKEQGFH